MKCDGCLRTLEDGERYYRSHVFVHTVGGEEPKYYSITIECSNCYWEDWDENYR